MASLNFTEVMLSVMSEIQVPRKSLGVKIINDLKLNAFNLGYKTLKRLRDVPLKSSHKTTQLN